MEEKYGDTSCFKHFLTKKRLLDFFVFILERNFALDYNCKVTIELLQSHPTKSISVIM